MNLSAHIIINRGTFTLDAALEVAAGQTVAIVGPNGAGKTTLLRALAGLTPLTDGHITLGGRVLDDPAANIFIQPEDRPISVLFQGLLLFPHLSALDNIAFGLRRRGRSRAEARAAAAKWLATFGLADKSKARPRELSGGQAQRVALARALAPHPELLLLDEPLSALDVSTRTDVRRDLTHALTTFPGVRLIITHDPTEALTLADHLLILEHGHVVQAGTPEQITAQPRSSYVARFVGVNLLRGHADHNHITVTGGLELTTGQQNVTGDAYALIQPQAISLHLHPPNGSPRNVWPGHVHGLDRNGHTVRVAVDGKPPVVAEITPAAASELALVPGTAVWVSVKATEVLTYPA